MKTLNPHASGQHQQVLLLLPWYLNKTLQTHELKQVANHLHSCLVCRRELIALDRLASAVKQSSDLETAAEMSFAGLKSKLPVQQALFAQSNDLPRDVKGTSSFYGRLKTRCHRLLPKQNTASYSYLAIAASILIAAIPLALNLPGNLIKPDYYTLSAAETESFSGQLRVVFSKPLPKSEIDVLLSQIQGQLIDGPNSVGAYTIKLLEANPNVATINAAVDLLREQPEVMLAEPVLQP